MVEIHTDAFYLEFFFETHLNPDFGLNSRDDDVLLPLSRAVYPLFAGQSAGAQRQPGRVHIVQVLDHHRLLGPGRGQQHTDRRPAGDVRRGHTPRGQRGQVHGVVNA